MSEQSQPDIGKDPDSAFQRGDAYYWNACLEYFLKRKEWQSLRKQYPCLKNIKLSNDTETAIREIINF